MTTKSFFGKCDRKEDKVDGEIINPYPTWYQEHLLPNYEQERSDIEDKLEDGGLTKKEKTELSYALARVKSRINAIKVSDPRNYLKGKDFDKIKKIEESIGAKITKASFPKDDLKKTGNADPAEFLKRSKTPCVSLDKATEAGFLKAACNIKMTENTCMTSLDELKRAWKFCRKILGMPTNVAYLYPTRLTDKFSTNFVGWDRKVADNWPFKDDEENEVEEIKEEAVSS